MEITDKQINLFIAWYKNRYWSRIDTIYKTSMELIWIPEENDIDDWKEFLKSILWKKYNKKIKNRHWYQLNWELIFNSLYSNYWPKWM